MNKIEVNGLTFSYEKRASSGRINVLSDLSFTAAEGERIGLIGANGAGKSTLLKLMVGLLTDYEGDMRIGGSVWRKILWRISEEGWDMYFRTRKASFLCLRYTRMWLLRRAITGSLRRKQERGR